MHLKIEKNEHITGYVGNIAGWLEADVQCSGRRYLSKIKKILKSSILFKEEISLTGIKQSYFSSIASSFHTFTFIHS